MMIPEDLILIVVGQNYDSVGISINLYWNSVAKRYDINDK